MDNAPKATKLHSLTPLQRRVVATLLTAPSITRAAETLGCSRSAIHVHLRNPDVREALRCAQTESLETTLRALTQLAEQAVETLGSVLRNADSDIVLVTACRLILDMGLKYSQALDVEQRLQHLENLLEEQHHG